MRTGSADRGAEVKPVCRLAAGLNHWELGVQPRQCQDSFQDLLVWFFFIFLHFFKEFEGIKLIK